MEFLEMIDCMAATPAPNLLFQVRGEKTLNQLSEDLVDAFHQMVA